MVLVVKNPPAQAGDIRDMVRSLGWEDSLEEGMATHSSILAWRIPWMEEPGKLPSIGSLRVGHYWSHLALLFSTDFSFRVFLSWISLSWESRYHKSRTPSLKSFLQIMSSLRRSSTWGVLAEMRGHGHPCPSGWAASPHTSHRRHSVWSPLFFLDY